MSRYGRNTFAIPMKPDFGAIEATGEHDPSQLRCARLLAKEEWEGDGGVLHYVQDTPIQAFFSVLSPGIFEVFVETTSAWKGNDTQLYYQKGMVRTRTRFVDSYKMAWNYFSGLWRRPVQNKIAESWEFLAICLQVLPPQSFPNTVPLSAWKKASDGVADCARDQIGFDYVYYCDWPLSSLTVGGGAFRIHAKTIPRAEFNFWAFSWKILFALILSERKFGKKNMKRF